MAFSTPCPHCQEPVTFQQVVLAPTPAHITCRHCQTRLHVKPWVWVVCTLFLLVVLGTVGFLLYQHMVYGVSAFGMLRVTMLGFLALAVAMMFVILNLQPFSVKV